MKITRNQLRRIIKEEINRVNEGSGLGPYITARSVLEDLYGISSEKAAAMFQNLPEDVQRELLTIVGPAARDMRHHENFPEIGEKIAELQKAGRLPK